MKSKRSTKSKTQEIKKIRTQEIKQTQQRLKHIQQHLRTSNKSNKPK